MLKPSAGSTWEFGRFKVLVDLRVLVDDATPVPLTSKAFDTLAVLIANRDRVVTKDELLQAVWPDVEVEEGNLTQQVFLLRKALGESAQQPRFIVTVPGHGYRFTGQVRDIQGQSSGSESRDAVSSSAPASRPAWLISAGLLVPTFFVLLVMLGARWLMGDNAVERLDLTSARITRVTESGNSSNAAMSSDGRYVAYTENEGDKYSIWVKHTSTGGTTQVVAPQQEILAHLAFSPDGDYVYFARGAPTRGGFMLSRVPTIGGLETRIVDDVDTPISFSPDGRQFVFMRGGTRESRIVIAEAGGGAQRVLASRKAPLSFLFVAPDWSPDGKLVAAVAADQTKGWRSSIVLLPTDGGEGRQLYASESRIGRVRWEPDGSGLLTIISEVMARQFAPWQAGSFIHLSGGAIWRIASKDGRAERLTSDLTDHDLCCLDLTANGRAVATVVNSFISDLWIASSDHLDAPKRITRGSPVITRHGWLPDNDTVIYRDLSGRLNGVHRDGRAFNLPLPDGQKASGGVAVCDRGHYVVFQAYPANNIWRTSITGGGAAQLTTGADSNPSCSGDGKAVFYSTVKADVSTVWQIPIEGGEPTPLVATPSMDALPSPSGHLIYYSAFEWEEHPVRVRRLRWIIISAADRNRLFSVNAPSPAIGILPAWSPDESGLDFVMTEGGVSNIWRQPLTGEPPLPITHFSSGRIFSFAWSPDGRWLSLGSGSNRSDVVVMSTQP